MTPTPQFSAQLDFHFREHIPDRRRWFMFDESLHRRVPMHMDGVEGLNTVGPELFRDVVAPGVKFRLWDAGFFADGVVLDRVEAGWPTDGRGH